MTARQETVAKLVLLGFVLFFVLFFSRSDKPVGAVALGEVAPNFTLPDDAGKPVSLADFKGKVVILNFWASWCVPCVEEMPSLRRFAAHYQDQDVVVIGISRDADPQAYKDFLLKYEINFLNLRDARNSVGEVYGTYQLPETYVIGRDGRLANKVIGARDWAAPDVFTYIDSLLAS